MKSKEKKLPRGRSSLKASKRKKKKTKIQNFEFYCFFFKKKTISKKINNLKSSFSKKKK